MHPVEQMRLILDHRKGVIDEALTMGNPWHFKITREDGVVIEMSISPGVEELHK